MNKNVILLMGVLGMAALNLGSIRKAEDPIRDTQTNPILYEQKKEEEKDGKKGPLLYHVKNSPYETFFIDPPFEANKESFAGGAMLEGAPAPAESTDWWEEQPAAPQAVPPMETLSETPPEFFPGSEKVEGDGSSEQPAAEAEAEKAPPGKGDDYWW